MDDEVTSLLKELEDNVNDNDQPSALVEKIYNKMVKMYLEEKVKR